MTEIPAPIQVLVADALAPDDVFVEVEAPGGLPLVSRTRDRDSIFTAMQDPDFQCLGFYNADGRNLGFIYFPVKWPTAPIIHASQNWWTKTVLARANGMLAKGGST